MANGLLDLLGGLGTTPPAYLEGLLGQPATEDLRKRSIGTGLANALVGYLAMPKNQNLGLGRILAGSAQAGLEGARGVYTDATQDYMQAQKIAEMQRLKKQQEAQDLFRSRIGKPNATRDIVTQPAMQVPVPTVEGAVAPSFETQMQAPVVTQEQYYDPNKMIEEGLASGALDPKDYLAYAAKAKAGTEILTPEIVAKLKLPTDRGQVYQRDLTTNKVEMIQGTLAAEPKSKIKILNPQETKLLGLPTDRGQVYQQDMLTNKIDTIEGTVAPASAGGEAGVDYLTPAAQAKAAVYYNQTGMLPPLGGGKNAGLVKANIMNMAALMDKGKSPEDAASAVMNNAQNYKANLAAIKSFNTGIEGRSTRSLNTVMYHLDTLDEAGKALNNGDIRLFNSIGNRINKEIGVAAPTDFEATKKIVSSEIIKAITGVGGALADREEAQKTLDAASSPAQLSGVINQYKELFAGQLVGLEQSYTASTNRPADEFRKRLDPRTRKLLPQTQTAKPMQTKAPAVAVPAGVNVDPVTWSYMTDEERAKFLPKK
jgi:hypothetical protein